LKRPWRQLAAISALRRFGMNAGNRLPRVEITPRFSECAGADRNKVDDLMQRAVVPPDRTRRRNFHSEFKPDLTPPEMLELGRSWRQVFERLPERISSVMVQPRPLVMSATIRG
jgi:hypothetical protein